MTIAKKITQTKTAPAPTPVVAPAPAPASAPTSDFTSSGSVERVIPSMSVVEVPVVSPPPTPTPTPDDSLYASHPILEPTASSHTEESC